MTIDGEWMMTVAKGGNCEVMSAESSENCVSGLLWMCGFARAEANEAGKRRLDHVISRSDYTRGGDGQTGKESKKFTI